MGVPLKEPDMKAPVVHTGVRQGRHTSHVERMTRELRARLPHVDHHVLERDQGELTIAFLRVENRLGLERVEVRIYKREIHPVVSHSAKVGVRDTDVLPHVALAKRLTRRVVTRGHGVDGPQPHALWRVRGDRGAGERSFALRVECPRLVVATDDGG